MLAAAVRLGYGDDTPYVKMRSPVIAAIVNRNETFNPCAIPISSKPIPYSPNLCR
jgi:hypothetical protein